jgi:hypothetical protein
VADQATSVETKGDSAAVASPAHGGEQHLEHNGGRPISWIGVAIAVVGAIVGGVAFFPHLQWWLFWVGSAIFVVGLLVMAVAKTFTEDWY